MWSLHLKTVSVNLQHEIKRALNAKEIGHLYTQKPQKRHQKDLNSIRSVQIDSLIHSEGKINALV